MKEVKGFGTVKNLVIAALLCACSVVFGKLPSLNIGDVLRFSFENLPVILAGYALGPLAGALTGAAADLLGCVLKGFSINPVITLGAAAVGGIAGLVRFCLFKKRHSAVILLIAVTGAHLIGNLVIKTAGLYWWYEALRPTLIWRVPIYLLTMAVEYGLLVLILKQKAIRRVLLGEGTK